MYDETYIKMNKNYEHAINQQNCEHHYGIKISGTNIRSAKKNPVNNQQYQ